MTKDYEKENREKIYISQIGIEIRIFKSFTQNIRYILLRTFATYIFSNV